MDASRNAATLLGLTASLALSTAGAHHGYAAHYDISSPLVLEGTAVELKLVNPHAYVFFDVVGDDGEVQNWRCELGTRLSRFGWTKESLAPGGRIRITGNPAKREDYTCHTEFIEHEDGRTFPFRGPITEGTSTYVPSDGTQFANVDGTANPLIIATGNTAAGSRIMVEVPEEGFFGYWAAPGGTGLNFAPGSRRGPGRAIPAVESELPAGTNFWMPDYTPEGQAMVDAFDPGFDLPALQCRGSIFDALVHHGISNEFVQVSDDTIRWVYGYMDMVRIIHMDQTEHPETLEPAYMGHSIGHWEGETLVVETVGFRKDMLIVVSGDPVINSEQFRVVERITHDAPLDQLAIEYETEDPLYWKSPINGVMRLERQTTPYETYNCVELAGENNIRPDGSTIFD